MTSISNTRSETTDHSVSLSHAEPAVAPLPASSTPDDPILDAAREVILRVGVRRTTATDVARRAGVSRMTLYRRFQDVQSLLVALLTREVNRLLGEIEATVATLPTARERLVTAAITGVQRLAADPLFLRLVEVDPELLLPYLLERSGSSQLAIRAYLTRTLTAGQADGSIRPLDVAYAAQVLQLTLQSFVLSSRIIANEADPSRIATELADLLNRYLAPSHVICGHS